MKIVLNGGIIEEKIDIIKSEGKLNLPQRRKIMPQMMMDILQYVPYALLLAFSISLLGIGGLYTFLFFRKAGERSAKETVSLRKN